MNTTKTQPKTADARQKRTEQAAVKHTPETRPPWGAAPEIAIGKADGALVDQNGFYIGELTKREVVKRYNEWERVTAERDQLWAALQEIHCTIFANGFKHVNLKWISDVADKGMTFAETEGNDNQ